MPLTEKQACKIDEFNTRHKTVWNILNLVHEELENEAHYEWRLLYRWENYIIRLHMYRKTCGLIKIITDNKEAQEILDKFDAKIKPQDCDVKQDILFEIRSIFEHYDDYVMGKGRNKKINPSQLSAYDFSKDEYNFAHYSLDRKCLFQSAYELHEDINNFKKHIIDEYLKSRI